MSIPTADEVRELIRARVRDPELMMNIVDLGLIYDVEITDEPSAEVTMTLTSPGCPAGRNHQHHAGARHTAFPDLAEVNIHLT